MAHVCRLRLFAFALCAWNTAAHRGALTRPSCGDDFGSSATALQILEPKISWAFKHYLDCTHRSVWMKFTNPMADFMFYVGVGIPTMPRFADLRADAVILGPGLPQLSEQDLSLIPETIRNDPVFANAEGGILRRSPADQSTCDHLGPTMTKSSTVKDGRCDFYEPFGGTHSWRVLDGDENNIPVANAEYHVAVWLQEETSGKIGIAMGTWVEDFGSPMDIPVPGCTRNMDDFSEKKGAQPDDFPVLACSGDSQGGIPQDTGSSPASTECAMGALCTDPDAGACSEKYDVKMGCGGSHCTSAVRLWDEVNMKMHSGMAIKFSGDAALDFVRGMIPHHQGAVDMCEVLVVQLMCKTWEDIGDLDGLVHFCNHVRLEQDRELAVMRSWLSDKQMAEHTACDDSGGVSMGCGDMDSTSSKEYVKANMMMHGGMAIDFTCEHDIDFTRGMIPHHAGAIHMCEVMLKHTTSNSEPVLEELCANITRLQYAEIAWMSRWLDARGYTLKKSCPCDQSPPMQMPCEDTLSASSFCHMLGGDFYCKCSETIKDYGCGTNTHVEGFGNLNVSHECARTCGHCPSERSPLLFESSCFDDHGGHKNGGGSGMQHSNGGSGKHDEGGSGMHKDTDGMHDDTSNTNGNSGMQQNMDSLSTSGSASGCQHVLGQVFALLLAISIFSGVHGKM